MMTWSKWLLTAAFVVQPLAVQARAQDYPTRPVTIVVPTGPGGGMEMVARLLAPKLEQRLGKPFIIENRPGAGTNIGAAAVARAAPDGYSLLMATSSTMSINVSIYKSLPFDPQKDLMPVALYARVPFVLVVNPSSPARTAADLVRLAKQQPGKLTYASSGAGGAIHLASELFKREAGVDLVHVPYRGGGPAMVGLLAGDVDVFISDLSTTIENIRGGRVKALAMAWPTRSPFLPETPTFAELGYPAVVSSSWFGLAAPAGTPAEIVERLAQAAKQANAAPEYLASLKKLGNEPFALTPEQSQAFIKAEVDKWAAVARSANIQVE